jgi:hypothetical protein
MKKSFPGAHQRECCRDAPATEFSPRSRLGVGRRPGDPAYGIQDGAHDQAGREVRRLRPSKEIRGRRFTARQASTLRNVNCQSLYFGPPW